MMMTGHKTHSVFGRYNIVPRGDLRDAAPKLDAAGAGHNIGYNDTQTGTPRMAECNCCRQ
jgi:hypothetical protein